MNHELCELDPSVTFMTPSSSLKNKDPCPPHFLICVAPWKQGGSPKFNSYLPVSKEIHICSVSKPIPVCMGLTKDWLFHAGT